MKKNNILLLMVLLLMNGCGTVQRDSIPEQSVTTQPDLSESARVSDCIAFIKSDGIYVMEYGKTPNKVYDGHEITNLQFSPSGKYIAFYQERQDYLLDVFVVDIESAAVKRATKGGNKDFACAEFIWHSQKDILYFTVNGVQDCIWSYDATTGEQAQLLKDERGYYNIMVSPDGRALYYRIVFGDQENHKLSGIYRFDLVEQKEGQVLSSKEHYPAIASLHATNISDNGEWLYFLMDYGEPTFSAYNLVEDRMYENKDFYLRPWKVSSLRNGQILGLNSPGYRANENARIVLYDCKTDDVRYLSPENKAAKDPVLSPDQSKVSFCAFDGLSEEEVADKFYSADWHTLAKNKIYVAEIGNPSPKVIVDGGGKTVDWSPRFLSDNKTVLFMRADGDGNISLWSVGINGGNLKMVADGFAFTPTDDYGSDYYNEYGQNYYEYYQTFTMFDVHYADADYKNKLQ